MNWKGRKIKMKDKLKIAILACVAIVIILIIVLMINIQGNNNKNNTIISNNIENIIEQTPIVTSRKINNYIDILKDKYYMKYVTKTEDEDGNIVDLNVEFALSGDNIYMNYPELFTTILVTKDASYYILHDSKITQKYPIDSEGQKQYYTLQRNVNQAYFEQNFVGTGTQEIEGIEYYYEEYKSGDDKIRYYFDENDKLVYIENISDSESEIDKIIEIREFDDLSIFELPEGYTEYDMTSLLEYDY